MTITGGLDLPAGAAPDLRRGPIKLLAADHALPSPERWRRTSRRRIGVAGRSPCTAPAAPASSSRSSPSRRRVHARETGSSTARSCRSSSSPGLHDLGVIVVTQPGFVLDRGDRYLREVADDEHADLWRCGTLVAAGVGVSAGSDAPYGDPDPWRSIVAAVDRRTRSGRPFGRDERVPADIAPGDVPDVPRRAGRSPPERRARCSRRGCACSTGRSPTRCVRPVADAVRATVGRSGWRDAP